MIAGLLAAAVEIFLLFSHMPLKSKDGDCKEHAGDSIIKIKIKKQTNRINHSLLIGFSPCDISLGSPWGLEQRSAGESWEWSLLDLMKPGALLGGHDSVGGDQ